MNKTVRKILIVSLILNIVLAIIKLIGGYLGNTTSLVSDGYNSLTDVFISLVLFFTIMISTKKPDKDHPYGHEKFEGIFNLLLGLVLFATAAFIFYEGISNLVNYDGHHEYVGPSRFTIYIAGISIFVKLFIYNINVWGYKKHKQVSLKAESYNHLGDIFATTTSLVGIIFASFNYIYIDYIASLIIGLFIFKNAITVIKESISFLVDEAPSKEEMKVIKEVIKNVNGVLAVDDLKARRHVSKIYVDVEISVKRDLTLMQAHEIAEEVHLTVEHKFPDVIHCMVHYNPIKKP